MLPKTLKFNGKVVGNVLRKDFGSHAQISNAPPKDVEVSQIEIEMRDNGFGLNFTLIEIPGHYRIGNFVGVTLDLS